MMFSKRGVVRGKFPGPSDRFSWQPIVKVKLAGFSSGSKRRPNRLNDEFEIPLTRLPLTRLMISLVSLPSPRLMTWSSASTRGRAPYWTLLKSRSTADEVAGSQGGAVIPETASAPRLAAWPERNLTYSSPIRLLKTIGQPAAFVATATTNPITPGSVSDMLKVVVWLPVRQMKESATEQVEPSTKKRWTKTSAELVLVMLMRVFSAPGLLRLEV